MTTETAVEPQLSSGQVDPAPKASGAEDRLSVATQWQLMWWRFRKHRIAILSTAVVLGFYLLVIFADFLAYSNPLTSEAQRSLLPPQRIHFFDKGHFWPHVYGLTGERDEESFKRIYTPDLNNKIHVSFFARGFEYRFLGVIPTT